MVPPLPAAPRTHSIWGNNQCYNILEGLRTSIWSITKSCRACQVKKKQKLKCRHLPLKTVITVPNRLLSVDHIGPYTLKGKDGTVIDFMALMMIDPATTWFEIMKLPLIHWLKTIAVDGKGSSMLKKKSSDCIARLVNKMWLSIYPWYVIWYTTMVVNSNWLLNTHENHMVLSISQPQ